MIDYKHEFFKQFALSTPSLPRYSLQPGEMYVVGSNNTIGYGAGGRIVATVRPSVGALGVGTHLGDLYELEPFLLLEKEENPRKLKILVRETIGWISVWSESLMFFSFKELH